MFCVAFLATVTMMMGITKVDAAQPNYIITTDATYPPFDFQDKNNKNINDYKSIFVSVKNNISIYIVEVPNETAPSIQGFAKPPA